MACWKILTLFGLVLNSVGVILLFFYVLPQRVQTDGIRGLWQGSVVDQKLLRDERHWDFLSAIVVGDPRHRASRLWRLAFAVAGRFSAEFACYH
jgi:hypothetical protein